MNDQFSTVVVNTALGDTKSITFPCAIDCDGQALIGKLYTIGSGDGAIVQVTSGDDYGKEKGKNVTLTIAVTGVPAGGYGLKIYTEEAGVVAKAICVIK